MKKRKVVAGKNLPAKFPIMATVNIILICKYVGIPEWAKGALVCFISLVWVFVFFALFREEESVDIFDNSGQKEKP